VAVEYASEFNYNEEYLVTDHTMCVVITQSGETADTLTAARRMRGMGCNVFAITNVLGSTAARESDGTLYIQAGPEIAVASTKAYTAQMVASYLLALRLALANGYRSISLGQSRLRTETAALAAVMMMQLRMRIQER
jgi:glucosamine--fructose-6-phosphate aminotransferase (isomerizing)